MNYAWLKRIIGGGLMLTSLAVYAHDSDKAIGMRHKKRYNSYEIGKWSYGSPHVYSWGEGTTLKVGSYCSIARGVTILLGGNHRSDWVTTYPFSALWPAAQHISGHPATKGNVVIGNDVWIGQEAFILSGVTIGDGAVVGARSVVTKDVPPYAIVGGFPAKILRWRFSAEQIGQLLRIAWWQWPEEKIAQALPLMLSSDINAFIQAYTP